MKVVDGSKSTKTIVTHTEIRTPRFRCHVKCKQEAFTVNPLWQALKNSRDQKDMPIFNRTDLLKFIPSNNQSLLGTTNIMKI